MTAKLGFLSPAFSVLNAQKQTGGGWFVVSLQLLVKLFQLCKPFSAVPLSKLLWW